MRANAICPGFFPAEQNRKLLDPERIDNIMRHTPMKRFGEPEELIGALLLLVSPQGRQFHHRHARQRRRRLYGRVVLSEGNASFNPEPTATAFAGPTMEYQRSSRRRQAVAVGSGLNEG